MAAWHVKIFYINSVACKHSKSVASETFFYWRISYISGDSKTLDRVWMKYNILTLIKMYLDKYVRYYEG